jgi:hypothetical protein
MHLRQTHYHVAAYFHINIEFGVAVVQRVELAQKLTISTRLSSGQSAHETKWEHQDLDILHAYP